MRHLTALAREGRLLCTTTNVSAPEGIARIATLLQERNAKVKVLNLSNVLDYVPSVAEVCEALQQLPIAPDGRVALNGGWFHVFRHQMPRPSRQLVERMGSLDAPSHFEAGCWVGNREHAERLERGRWSSPDARQKFWDVTRASLAPGPESEQGYHHAVEVLAEVSQDWDSGRQGPLRAPADSLQPRWRSFTPRGWLDTLDRFIPEPTSPDELPQALERLETFRRVRPPTS